MNERAFLNVGEGIGFTRRQTLFTSIGGFLGFSLARQAELFGAAQPQLLVPQGSAARARAVIVLWMDGEPSQFETWDPKEGRENGGPTKAIPTSVRGIRYADNLPACAKQARHIAVVRSVTSRQSDHEQASYFVHTGYDPGGALVHPSIGSVTAMEIGQERADLPSYIVIDGQRVGRSAGFLPPRVEPFSIPGERVPNVAPPSDVSRERFRGRMQLLAEQDRAFAEERPAEAVERRVTARDAADRLMHSPLLEGFDLSRENEELRRQYGENPFGRGCLLARRLVERGVKFVEVNLKGWDTHSDNFVRTADLCKVFDPAMATLVRDLHDRRLLSETLVVWMGEFGRTPRINGNTGRDHYPKVWSVALAGGGIQGGRVVGASDPDGLEVAERPVRIADLFATLYGLLGVPLNKVYPSPLGRPIKIVDNGLPVRELIG